MCEIPKWTRKKYEIATGEIMNPIKQDVKNGVLREYKWGDMLFNYGAFPQTWEDPKHVSSDTGFPGDNVPQLQGICLLWFVRFDNLMRKLRGTQDPIDVIELGARQRAVGSIVRVKILGLHILFTHSSCVDISLLCFLVILRMQQDPWYHCND